MILSFVFVGELYIWDIESIYDEYSYVTFYLQNDQNQLVMIEDIINAAEATNIDVFVVEKNVTSLFASELYIYGTRNCRAILGENNELFSGTYTSFFLGTTNIEFLSLNDIQNVERFEKFYVIGSRDDAIRFKQLLVDKYAGSFPRHDSSNRFSSKATMWVLWMITFSFILLMSYFDSLIDQKESVLKALFGTNIVETTVYTLIVDTMIFTIIFFGAKYILSFQSNVRYLENISYVTFILFLLGNSIIYIRIFFLNFRKDIYISLSALGALKFSYIFKLISSVIIIIILAGSAEVISNGINLYQQRDFFETYRDYSFYTFGGKSFEDVEKLMQNIHMRAIEKNECVSLIDISQYGNGVNCILSDISSKEFITSKLPELKEFLVNKKVYYIIPESELDDELISNLNVLWDAYSHELVIPEVVTYKDKINMIGISNIGKIYSRLYENPVIILNNQASESLEYYTNEIYVANSTIFNLSEEDWNNIINVHGVEDDIHYRTNIYENYMYQWRIEKRNIYISIILSALLLLLEVIVIKIILRYEYTLNAVYLVIMKLLGHTIIFRIRKLLIHTAIGLLSSFVLLLFIYKYLYSISSNIAYISLLLIMLIECVFIFYEAYKLERKSVYRVIKGGII